jgi:hypothetical protein
MLPFDREQFFAVFADYNRAVWPVQALAYLLALAAVALMLRRARAAERAVPALLALMWAWTGIAYHALFFAAINKAALAFAALFVLQALGFAQVALQDGLRFSPHRGARAACGWALVAYAVIAYPLIGLATGHGWPALPMFGVTPCPITLFTFGVLLLAQSPLPRRLLVIPLLWALIGGSAAWLLGVAQDWPLLISGVLVAPWLWRQAPAAMKASPG